MDDLLMIYPFIFDSLLFFLLLMILFEWIFVLVVFLICNLIYRDKNYLKKTIILVAIFIIYNLTLFISTNQIWICLEHNYNRYFDLMISFGIPFVSLGSLSSLYLIFKRKKIKYIIIYGYIILCFEYETFILATSTTTTPSNYLINDTFSMIFGMIFFIFYFGSILWIFLTLDKYYKENLNEKLIKIKKLISLRVN